MSKSSIGTQYRYDTVTNLNLCAIITIKVLFKKKIVMQFYNRELVFFSPKISKSYKTETFKD